MNTPMTQIKLCTSESIPVLGIRCPRNHNKSAEQIGKVQKPNKAAEQIGKVGKSPPPTFFGGAGYGTLPGEVHWLLKVYKGLGIQFHTLGYATRITPKKRGYPAPAPHFFKQPLVEVISVPPPEAKRNFWVPLLVVPHHSPTVFGGGGGGLSQPPISGITFLVCWCAATV